MYLFLHGVNVLKIKYEKKKNKEQKLSMKAVEEGILSVWKIWGNLEGNLSSIYL